MTAIDDDSEWLEADGIGGFASGTVSGVRTRRYHGLLTAATTPPTGRVVLVNGLEAWCETEAGAFALTSQRYAPDVLHPDGARRIVAFAHEPWPTWTFALPGGSADGTTIVQEVLVEPDSCETILRWRRVAGEGACRLHVRPLLSGRDYHALQRENAGFRFEAAVTGQSVSWQPYPGRPAIGALSNGTYAYTPDWYRSFLYEAEAARGLDAIEDLAAPGTFSFDLAAGPACLVLRPGTGGAARAQAHAERVIEAERVRRARLGSGPERAARAYLVDRGPGRTLLAGFPWFTDWGRDTFIALRGLLIATGDLAAAEAILAGWAGAVSEGMMPNRFPDGGEPPEYNAVDAALWYVVAVHDFLEACREAGRPVAPETTDRLLGACGAIVEGYAAGTRYRIGADIDGLLRAGEPGLQLTWMDAKVGDRVVTPRIGKPVEVQALWINALHIASLLISPRWSDMAALAQASFALRFPKPKGGLFDVVDADHERGRDDGSVRPNQILAVGGLPFPVLSGAAARAVVDHVEAALLTPLGLRSLAPDDPAYVGRYGGDPAARDGAYHQGTVWPWLIGPFVDAWLAVRDRSAAAKSEARARFLPPLLRHLDQAGLGHVCEVADGDPPHRPGGCPFQAWSLGELIRVRRMLD